jgi:uncharacterized membrane protein
MQKIFENFIEIISFVKIVLSPLLVGLFLGIVAYAYIGEDTGVIVGMCLTLLGLISGILLARWAKKRSGSAEAFNSVIHASPDLDKIVKGK